MAGADPEQVLHLFGRRLRQRREHVGISRLELGGRVGLSASDVRAIETGDHDVDLLTLRRIAVALGTSLMALTTDGDETPH